MGKGGMGMVGANFSEGVKKHHNPKWDKEKREEPERGAPGGQGLTLVHFPAQLEPRLTHISPCAP